ncbi:MAG: hypothetical protein IPK79_01350 [Vampirovibrionales bacterium]|nr:hypothetical protein [Vampirovibrionales bacterium]
MNAPTQTPQPAPPPFILPGAEDRTVVVGPTGSGKTVLGAWVLSEQHFQRRPWVAFDFKEEELWDDVGSPPMRRLRLGDMPGKRGLYRCRVNPGDDDVLEDMLWNIWRKGNIGIFCDEVSLMPRQDAFKAILRQGRSKLIPVISCTQRPVDCDREVFTESQIRVLFGIEDMARDYPIIKGLWGGFDVRKPLPSHWSYWYDAKRKALHTLRPVPAPAIVAAKIRAAAPRQFSFGG